MNNRIVYTRSDGGVSVVVPAPKARRKGESDEDFLSRIRAKSVPPDAANVAIVNAGDLPSDRTFRDAWTCDGKKVGHDMVKCRAIHMDRIRFARDAKLRHLDIEQLKGLDVQAEKQGLRDLTQTFDLSKATTPEELKALWPAELA